MNARGLRRYVDDLLRGRRPRPFLPDDFEAAQLRTAIPTRRARNSSPICTGGWPSRCPARRPDRGPTSAAATAAVAAVSIDRTVIAGQSGPDRAPQIASGTLAPNQGSWQRVAASSEVPDGVLRAFDLGAVSGFVRRVDGKVQAISGVCTHQGCKLWFDAPDDTLRCPCHTTSFSPSGKVLTHQLPIEPKPLPALMVREADGIIEVFAPVRRI